MSITTLLKNKTTIGELMNMPFKYVHTLYYMAWKKSIDDSEQAEAERKTEALEEALNI